MADGAFTMPGSAYDYELEQERGRWLRHRFLWFLGVSLALSLLMLPFYATSALSETGSARTAAVVYTGSVLLGMAAYGVAFAYAWVSRPTYTTIYRLALVVYIGVASAGMVLNRVALAFDNPYTAREVESQFEAGFVAGKAAAGGEAATPAASQTPASPYATHAVDAADGPDARDGTEGPSAVRVAAIANMGAFFLTHMLACLFLPWTFRESLVPAGVVGAVYLGLVAIDVVWPGYAPKFLVLSLLVFVSILPGSLICLLRTSRFTKDFRLRFESSAYHKLRRELDSARKIHEAFLPPTRLDTPDGVSFAFAYEPMSSVGGDVVFLPPGSDAVPTSVVLLDITGHGVPAALMVNRLIGELERIYGADPAARPGRVLTQLNDFTHFSLARQGMYVTGLVLQVDAAGRTLRYASAGHPPGLLLVEEGVEHLAATTMLLGAAHGEMFEGHDVKLSLPPGARLLVYTDGAFEARDRSGRMLGLAEMIDMARQTSSQAPPEQLPEKLMRQLAAFRGKPPDDDTLLACIWLTPVPADMQSDEPVNGRPLQSQPAQAATMTTTPTMSR
ncbi:MAG: PP2C family protein-serine/threonine phosphatase [Phycisphaerae bacterium]